jgi:hypothetical protein
MDKTRAVDDTRQAVAWGALFIWWGITEMVEGLPQGAGAIGIGVILLGLNASRRLQGAPISMFSTTLGILALVMGGLQLADSAMRLPFELPVFAIVLIVLGVIVIVREVAQAVSGRPVQPG